MVILTPNEPKGRPFPVIMLELAAGLLALAALAAMSVSRWDDAAILMTLSLLGLAVTRMKSRLARLLLSLPAFAGAIAIVGISIIHLHMTPESFAERFPRVGPFWLWLTLCWFSWMWSEGMGKWLDGGSFITFAFEMWVTMPLMVSLFYIDSRALGVLVFLGTMLALVLLPLLGLILLQFLPAGRLPAKVLKRYGRQ